MLRSRGSRLLLVGEPGIGKSYLLEAALRTAGLRGPVLFARGFERDGLPFGGLRGLLLDVDDRRIAMLPAQQAAAVQAVLGRNGQRVRPDEEALLAAVTRLLADLAGDGAALVLEDLQWLDGETGRLLQHVLAHPGVGGQLPIVAVRRADGSAPDPGFRRLFPAASVAVVPALREGSVQALLGEVFGARLPAAVRDDVAHRSEGNPLWATELASSRLGGAVASVSTGMVAATLERRLAGLPASVRCLLQLVSVLGRVRVGDLLVADPEVLGALELAVCAGVLGVVDEVVTLPIPLLGAVAVEQLDRDGRRGLHERAAALPLDEEQKAEHLDLAQDAGPDEALAQHLMAAARRAARSGDARTAFRLVHRSLMRLPLDAEQRPMRTVEAAEVAFAAGHLTGVLELLAQVDLARLPVQALDVAVDLLAEAAQRQRGRAALLQRLRAVQRDVPREGAAWRVLETHRLAHDGLGEPLAVERLLAMADGLDDRQSPRALSSAFAWALMYGLDRGDGLDQGLLRRVRALDASSPAPVHSETAEVLEATFAYQQDDLARSRARLPAMIRAADDAGSGESLAAARAHSVIVHLLSGDARRAAQELALAEAAAGGLEHPPSSLHRARGMLAVALDDQESLQDLLGGEVGPALEARADLLREGLAGLDAAAAGAWERALPRLEKAHRIAELDEVREPGRRLWIDIELGRALVRTGALDRARGIAAALAEVGARPGRVHARGQARRLQALIAEQDGALEDALELFGRALHDLRAGGYGMELLRAEAERLRLLLRMRRPHEVRGALPPLLEAARRAGDPRLAAELESIGTTMDAPPAQAPLTAAERRVALAAVSGRSNREIAGDLFLSVRTVESHLGSVYRKVGVRTRTQLALALSGAAGVPLLDQGLRSSDPLAREGAA